MAEKSQVGFKNIFLPGSVRDVGNENGIVQPFLWRSH